MCFVSDLDMGWPAVYRRSVRMARKAHPCGDCHRVIQPGDRYEYHSGVYDGSGWNARCCLRCGRVRDKLEVEASGWNVTWFVPFGELKCCLRERNRERRACAKLET